MDTQVWTPPTCLPHCCKIQDPGGCLKLNCYSKHFFRAIERMRSDQFLSSLLPCHASLACLLHTCDAISTLVRLHWSISAHAGWSKSVDSGRDEHLPLRRLSEAIAAMSSGMARAATAAAGGLNVAVPLLREGSGLASGSGGSIDEGWRQGRRLLTADVMHFAIARLHKVIDRLKRAMPKAAFLYI